MENSSGKGRPGKNDRKHCGRENAFVVVVEVVPLTSTPLSTKTGKNVTEKRHFSEIVASA
jgi:hypothetical protein